MKKKLVNKLPNKLGYKFLIYAGVIVFAFLPLKLLLANYFFSFEIFSVEKTNNQKENKRIGIVVKRNLLGEGQFANYNCKAANELGYDCYIFKFRNHHFDEKEDWKLNKKFLSAVQNLIHKFYPADLILYINPDMYLQNFPGTKTVGILDPGVIKNHVYAHYNLFSKFDLILGYDSSQIDELLESIKKPTKVGWPSMNKTEFYPGEKKKLFFSGANLGHNRQSDDYKRLYQILGEKPYAEIYGPKKLWGFLKKGYKGYLKPEEYKPTMQKAGIALLLHGDLHLQKGVPSSGVFEAAANSMVIISDEHAFVRKYFGDCVWFIDEKKAQDQIAKAIDSVMQTILNNPQLAQEKAKCAHTVFTENFTIEKQLISILEYSQK